MSIATNQAGHFMRPLSGTPCILWDTMQLFHDNECQQAFSQEEQSAWINANIESDYALRGCKAYKYTENFQSLNTKCDHDQVEVNAFEDQECQKKVESLVSRTIHFKNGHSECTTFDSEVYFKVEQAGWFFLKDEATLFAEDYLAMHSRRNDQMQGQYRREGFFDRYGYFKYDPYGNHHQHEKHYVDTYGHWHYDPYENHHYRPDGFYDPYTGRFQRDEYGFHHYDPYRYHDSYGYYRYDPDQTHHVHRHSFRDSSGWHYDPYQNHHYDPYYGYREDYYRDQFGNWHFDPHHRHHFDAENYRDRFGNWRYDPYGEHHQRLDYFKDPYGKWHYDPYGQHHQSPDNYYHDSNGWHYDDYQNHHHDPFHYKDSDNYWHYDPYQRHHFDPYDAYGYMDAAYYFTEGSQEYSEDFKYTYGDQNSKIDQISNWFDEKYQEWLIQ